MARPRLRSGTGTCAGVAGSMAGRCKCRLWAKFRGMAENPAHRREKRPIRRGSGLVLGAGVVQRAVSLRPPFSRQGAARTGRREPPGKCMTCCPSLCSGIHGRRVSGVRPPRRRQGMTCRQIPCSRSDPTHRGGRGRAGRTTSEEDMWPKLLHRPSRRGVGGWQRSRHPCRQILRSRSGTELPEPEREKRADDAKLSHDQLPKPWSPHSGTKGEWFAATGVDKAWLAARSLVPRSGPNPPEPERESGIPIYWCAAAGGGRRANASSRGAETVGNEKDSPHGP